jgi:K+-transporting ATPase c subunit
MTRTWANFQQKKYLHPRKAAQATMSIVQAEFNFELICDGSTQWRISCEEQLRANAKIDTSKANAAPANNETAAIAALF